jgi:Icc-related predicted phosphoesterase
MLVISDVHGAFTALRRVVSSEPTVLILGDLANLTDYRTGDGAVATAFGIDLARKTGEARGEGDFEEMRRLWRAAVPDAEKGRKSIEEAIESQYAELHDALAGGHGYVIHGNVDRTDRLVASLPASFSYVHGQKVEIDGVVFGFVGGGVRTPLRAVGEVEDDEMTTLLEGLGSVDVLCTHVAPAIESLHHDVVTGRAERSSVPVFEYLMRFQPRLHLFGDVHQPRATTWRVGATTCRNTGYFRATGRGLRLDPANI